LCTVHAFNKSLDPINYSCWNFTENWCFIICPYFNIQMLSVDTGGVVSEEWLGFSKLPPTFHHGQRRQFRYTTFPI